MKNNFTYRSLLILIWFLFIFPFLNSIFACVSYTFVNNALIDKYLSSYPERFVQLLVNEKLNKEEALQFLSKQEKKLIYYEKLLTEAQEHFRNEKIESYEKAVAEFNDWIQYSKDLGLTSAISLIDPYSIGCVQLTPISTEQDKATLGLILWEKLDLLLILKARCQGEKDLVTEALLLEYEKNNFSSLNKTFSSRQTIEEKYHILAKQIDPFSKQTLLQLYYNILLGYYEAFLNSSLK